MSQQQKIKKGVALQENKQPPLAKHSFAIPDVSETLEKIEGSKFVGPSPTVISQHRPEGIAIKKIKKCGWC